MTVHKGYRNSTGKKRDEWSTPQWLFDELNEIYKFTLDVCATAENTMCGRFFTKEVDGLKQQWEGVCWCNPPYQRGEIAKWMRKAYESSQAGATVVCLVQSSTCSRWWHDFAMRGEIKFIKGRVKFVKNGDGTKPANFASALVIFKGRSKASKAKPTR